MTRTQAETCPGCTSSLREDRSHGLIYGPYALESSATGGRTFVNSHVFAAATGECTYCGSELPKRRKRYLMRYVPHALLLTVAQYW